MRLMQLHVMLASAWLAGCSLVYSPADRQLGTDQQGSPIHQTDDEGESMDADAGRSHFDDDQSSVDFEDMEHGDDMPSDWSPDDEEVDMSPDEGPDAGDAGAGMDAGDIVADETDPDEIDPDDGPMCAGTSGNWAGCSEDGCSVCTEKLAEFPRYLENHPECVPSARCSGAYATCDARCPTPTDADRDVQQCHGSPGGWVGCRGTGCWVCAELLDGYPRYAQNHPGCIVNHTCAGWFGTCNAACPAPSEADR